MTFKALLIAALLALAPSLTFAAEERCGAHELSASLPLVSPSYSDAMVLKQDLTNDGWGVECVLKSKWAGMFGALFRTVLGDFEVRFVSPPHTFDELEIKEQKNGRFYDYSFTGYPKMGPVESGGRTYFVKRGNKLFMTYFPDLAIALAKTPMR